MRALKKASKAPANGAGLPVRAHLVCNSAANGRYEGLELSAPAVRAGADDHMAHPSRYQDRRVYRSAARGCV